MVSEVGHVSRNAVHEPSTPKLLNTVSQDGQQETNWAEKWKISGDFVEIDLILSNSLLLYQSKIVVPTSMQQMTLEKIYHGHYGIQHYRMQASSSVWWPGVSTAVERFVQHVLWVKKTLLVENPW